MSPRVRALLMAGWLAAAMAMTACGADKRPPPAKRAPEPPPSASAVAIATPDQGMTVRARAALTGTISALVTMSGHADALQVVRVDGRCPVRPCTKYAYTGPKGLWTAELSLVLPPHTRRWTATADYAVTPDARTAATVSFDVHAIKARGRPRAPRRKRETEPGGATTTQPPASPATPAIPAPTPTPSGTAGTLVLVGDSLAVGVRSLLPAALPNWKVQVLGRVGRPLAEGMSILSSLDLPQGTPRQVLAISLFTNDDPTHTDALQAAVRRTLALVGSHGCVIWATIARPPVNGVSYRAANTLLERLAASNPALVIAPWAEQVAANPALLGGDGVHPTPAGYQLRARLYAQATHACP